MKDKDYYRAIEQGSNLLWWKPDRFHRGERSEKDNTTLWNNQAVLEIKWKLRHLWKKDRSIWALVEVDIIESFQYR